LILLPDGYRIERDADVLTLLRADDSVVGRFSVRGVEWSEVKRIAEDDARCKFDQQRDEEHVVKFSTGYS